MSLTSALPSADMPRSMVWLFATASGLSVANVYYAQPLLDALANDFGISHAAVGGVVTATQIGCALALLLVVPLGDKVDRRRLMAVQPAWSGCRHRQRPKRGKRLLRPAFA